MIAFAMTLLIIAGEIDLFIAAIIARISMMMGLALQLVADTPVLIMVGLATGIIYGTVNGFFVVRGKVTVNCCNN